MQGGKHPVRAQVLLERTPVGRDDRSGRRLLLPRRADSPGPRDQRRRPDHGRDDAAPPGRDGRLAEPDPAGLDAVTIRFKGTERRQVTVLIYRTDLGSAPRLVDSFNTARRHFVTWNGAIGGTPAPAGTYLIGLRVTDLACNIGNFPAALPPLPGSTPHAGLTVRYLAADPPSTPIRSRRSCAPCLWTRGCVRYRWTLSQYGVRKPLATGHGHQPAAGAAGCPLPGRGCTSCTSARGRTGPPCRSFQRSGFGPPRADPGRAAVADVEAQILGRRGRRRRARHARRRRSGRAAPRVRGRPPGGPAGRGGVSPLI